MNLNVVVHQTEEGGYWAEVSAISGCVSQGDTMADLRANIPEAVEDRLSVEIYDTVITGNDHVIEVAV